MWNGHKLWYSYSTPSQNMPQLCVMATSCRTHTQTHHKTSINSVGLDYSVHASLAMGQERIASLFPYGATQDGLSHEESGAIDNHNM